VRVGVWLASTGFVGQKQLASEPNLLVFWWSDARQISRPAKKRAGSKILARATKQTGFDKQLIFA
jgi:hypothetical protein